MPVAYLAGRELVGRRTGLAVAAIVAVNPMLVWYSQDARAYALLVLLTTAALLFFIRARRSGSARDLGCWAVFSALALATHYFAFFGLAIEAALLLLAVRPLRRVLAALAGVALAGLALAPIALHQARRQEQRLDRQLRHGPVACARPRSASSSARRACSSTRWRRWHCSPPPWLCCSGAAAERERRGAAVALTIGGGSVAIALLPLPRSARTTCSSATCCRR